MSHRIAPLAVLLLSACAGTSSGPAVTHGTVPRDARGDAVLGAVPPPPPAPEPPPVIAAPPPGATVRS